jgi:hypothetical protein
MSILWNFDKYAKIEMLPFDPLCINGRDLFQISDHELLLKAGTPLAPAGEEDETPHTPGTVHPFDEEVPTCFAAEDYHFILTNAQQPNLVKCVTKGYIEKAKVLESMVFEEDPTADWAEDLAALGLYLVDDLGNLPGSSGGGSGGGLYVPMTTDDTDPENPVTVAGKTLGEMRSAVERGLFVYTTAFYTDPHLGERDYHVLPLQTITVSGAGGAVISFESQNTDLTLYAQSDDEYPTSVEPTPPAPDIGGGVG